MEQALTRQQVISLLTRSPHGELTQYTPVALRAANEDPEFYSRLVAWNELKGQIRDSRVALPVIGLAAPKLAGDMELRDNALAHMVKLDARNLVRSVRFAKSFKDVSKRTVKRAVELYLREIESSSKRFDRVALQHRQSMKELYALLHIKPSDYANSILFKGEKRGVFGVVARLKDMDPTEAAGTIMQLRIPFLVAQGAMGAKMKEPAVVQALIESMSPTELVTNTKMLERLGINTNPALRATYNAALVKAQSSKKATLKTARAAAVVGGAVGEKLATVQEKQLDAIAVEGDWLVLGDKSGSMTVSIEASRQIAAVLARAAKGKTHLVFFDSGPTYYDVTGKTLEEINEITKRVAAGGGTDIGCGAAYMAAKKANVDGIAIISDGGERGVVGFAAAYGKLCEVLDKEPPVYFYKVTGSDPDWLSGQCARAGVELTMFDLTGGVDYYSLPNIVQTMRTNRWSLADEIMATPLLRLAGMFQNEAAVAA